MTKAVHDADSGKGAVEQDKPNQTTNTSMSGQMGHRDDSPAKPLDTDFPEPGGREEHSGGK